MTATQRGRDVEAPSGRPPAGDVGLLAVAVVAVSTSGPLIAATVVPALAIALWRNAMAAGLLLPVVLATCRDELRGLTGREWRLAGLAGVLLGLHFAAWTPAVTMTSVATATALVATQPVWSALIVGLRGAPVSRSVWVGIGVAMAGALLLTGVDVQTSGRALAGDLLALVGGLFAAAYLVAGAEVRRSVSTTTYTLLCYSTAAALLLALCLLSGTPLSGYAGQDWAKLVALTVGAQLLGHSLFSRVLRSTSPTTVSLLILLEIPGAALIAALLLGQRVPLIALPAALLLVAGLAMVIRAGVPAAPVE